MRRIRRFDVGTDSGSLHWQGDDLIDYVGGNRLLRANGAVERPRVNWAFGFDRAVEAANGDLQILYVELGTKAIVASGSRTVRELNRSYYCSDAFEYPIATFALPDGREAIAHCPDEYNRLEFEVLQTGERLTTRTSESKDIFHSRLSTSPDGRHLLSAGWIWHPWGVAEIFDVAEALKRPEHLDEQPMQDVWSINAEIESACWLDNDRVVLATSPKQRLSDPDPNDLEPGQIGVWSVGEQRWLSQCAPADRVGTMHRLADNVLGLYDHPKLIDPATGEVLAEWPDLDTGRQDSSIVHHIGSRAPIAIDADAGRFAVAQGHDIVVVTI